MILNQSPPLLVSADLACTHFCISYVAVCQWSRISEQSAVCHIHFSFKVVKRSRFITFRSQPALITDSTFCKVSFFHYCLLQWSIASYLRLRKLSWTYLHDQHQTLVFVLPLFYWKLRQSFLSCESVSADVISFSDLYFGCKIIHLRLK